MSWIYLAMNDLSRMLSQCYHNDNQTRHHHYVMTHENNLLNKKD